MTAKLPKWIEVGRTAGDGHWHGAYVNDLREALSIAWAALDHYDNTHDFQEARKAMRKIRRIGR